MEKIQITTTIIQTSYDELSAQDKALVDAAKNATRASLATYSHFHVGAAILMDNGEIVIGANQENAAYPSGTCAERTAAYYASARYPGVPMKKLAVAAWQMAGKAEIPADSLTYNRYFQAMPISPCGACRQALLEYETKYGDIEVILYGREKIYIFPSIASLLPYCFINF